MNPVGSKKIARRLATALLMSAAPFITIEHTGAQAVGACTPATDSSNPVNGQPVTCTGGAITNQNDPNGYGTGVETGNTITIDSSATVTGTNTGISVNDATINNNGGTITGGFSALFFNNDSIVNNSSDPNNATVHGAISGATGIQTNTSVTAVNDGTISGTSAAGIDATGGTATVTNNSTGTITGVAFGIVAKVVNILGNSGTIESTSGTAIQAGRTNVVNGPGPVDGTINVSNGSTGIIRANGTNGVALFAAAFGTITINNDGMIQANGGRDNAAGVPTAGSAVVAQHITVNSNTGTIEATGQNGVAINASGTDGTANVTSSGTIFGAIRGIATDGLLTLNNSGVVRTNNNSASEFAVGSVSGDVIVTNSGNGSIGDANVGIQAKGLATIDNTSTNAQAIEGRTNAISAGSVVLSGNSGIINAVNANGVAIDTTTLDADITNSGTIQSTATGGIAIKAARAAIITDNAAGGTITGADTAISAPTAHVIKNAGTIQGVNSAISAATTTIDSNTGTIKATADSGSAIAGTTVSVGSNSGTITETGASGMAINGTAATVSSNSGTISADNGRAINGGVVDVTNSSQITSNNGTAIFGLSSTKVHNLQNGNISGGAVGIDGIALDVTNDAGATISTSAAGIAIHGSGSVTNSGTISGGSGGSVAFTGGAGVTNTLTLQTGSLITGTVSGSTAGATNTLVLNDHGTASNDFLHFDLLAVNADTSWTLSGNAGVALTNVNSGMLVVDGSLTGSVAVNGNGTLAGRGTVGPLGISGIVAPGAVVPFSALTVNGNVIFQPNSIYRVNVNAAGQNDLLKITGTGSTATLSGGTVNVLAQNGNYAPSTQYTILTAPGGLGGTNKFQSATTNLAFLTPALNYDDPTKVVLTMALNSNPGNGGGGSGGGGGGTTPAPTGLGFAAVAQTRNERAVASSLDGGPVNNPLIIRILNQTIDGARTAFDALSGEVFGSVHNTQGQEGSFTRSGVLGRLRQASYAEAPGELGALGFAGPELAHADGHASANSGSAASSADGRLAYAADSNGSMAADLPVKAPRGGNYSAGRDLTFWAQGLGGWGHSDSDGNAASLKSRFGGFLSGADMRFGQAWRAGLVAGYTRSDLKADARASSAGIDSVTVGLYAGGRLGAFNLRTGASFSYDSIDASRSVSFSGFSDATKAHFHGQVGQLFGEVGYGMGLGTFALEPFAGLAYVHLHDGAFLESGGIAALSGSSAHEDIGYSSLGIRAATFVPLGNGTVLVPRASAQWQHAFGDVTPVTALAFQSTGTAFTVAGIPIARDSALVEAGLDWRISPWTKLGAFYQGELAAHAQSHAIKGGFTLDF